MRCTFNFSSAMISVLVERVFLAKSGDAALGLVLLRRVLRMVEHERDDVGDLLHIGLLEAARRERGGAEADAARDERGERLEGDRVLVDRDVDLVEEILRLLAREVLAREIDEHEVVVRAARDDAEPVLRELVREHGGVLHDLLGIRLERGLQRLAERDGLRRDDVHERAALDAGEDSLVELLAELGVLAEDHAAARAAQRLVRRRRHDVGVRHRARMEAGGDEAGDVRDVDHEIRADAVRDLRHALEVDDARVGRGARDDELRLAVLCDALELVVVDALILLAHAVGNDVEILAAHVDGRAVREMAAVREVHAHDGIAGLEQREKDRHVRLRAGVRLDVRVGRAEELLRAVDSELLDDVDELAAAVITLAGIALGVLVREHAALRLEHSLGDNVLRGDELELRALAIQFLVDGIRYSGISGFQVFHKAHVRSSSPSHSFSSAMILFTRRSWRPPSKPVSTQARTISPAGPNPSTRPPIASTFASL